MADTIIAPIEITEVTIAASVTTGVPGPEGPLGPPGVGSLVMYGTGDPPDPTGMTNGSIYVRYAI